MVAVECWKAYFSAPPSQVLLVLLLVLSIWTPLPHLHLRMIKRIATPRKTPSAFPRYRPIKHSVPMAKVERREGKLANELRQQEGHYHQLLLKAGLLGEHMRCRALVASPVAVRILGKQLIETNPTIVRRQGLHFARGVDVTNVSVLLNATAPKRPYRFYSTHCE